MQQNDSLADGCCQESRWRRGRRSGLSSGLAARAVGEADTLLHPPLPSVGLFNVDGEGVSAK